MFDPTNHVSQHFGAVQTAAEESQPVFPVFSVAAEEPRFVRTGSVPAVPENTARAASGVTFTGDTEGIVPHSVIMVFSS